MSTMSAEAISNVKSLVTYDPYYPKQKIKSELRELKEKIISQYYSSSQTDSEFDNVIIAELSPSNVYMPQFKSSGTFSDNFNDDILGYDENGNIQHSQSSTGSIVDTFA